MLRTALKQSVVARKLSKRLRRLDPPREDWFESHYPEWRRKRVAAITEHYGASFFSGKALLEVGCGFGGIGAQFAALGARVTCSDARPEYLEEARRRHSEITTVVADLDGPWRFPRHQILLHLGVLYHLADPGKAVMDALGGADHIVLETMVCDSSDPYIVKPIVEVGYDQAFNNRGCRPSDAFVERLLSASGRPFERIADDRCNDGVHVYDWVVTDSGAPVEGLRRMWFIGPPV